jgi:hypothetical protein
MFVWSKRLAVGGLILFGIFEALLIFQVSSQPTNTLALRAIQDLLIKYALLNFALLAVWAFIWMFDQARLRGVNLSLWAVPFLFAPLPTLFVFILVLQRRR